MINRKIINNFFKKSIISLILLLIISLIIENNLINKDIINTIFKEPIKFSEYRNKLNVLYGKLKNKDTFVSSDILTYSSIESIGDSYKLTTGQGYVVKALKGGTVTFIGNKDIIGQTVIVSGDDGVNYWYSNIENINVKMYDYIKSNTIIGSTLNDYLYLTFNKEDYYLRYDKFI